MMQFEMEESMSSLINQIIMRLVNRAKVVTLASMRSDGLPL